MRFHRSSKGLTANEIEGTHLLMRDLDLSQKGPKDCPGISNKI
jgi:hypothetical protein